MRAAVLHTPGESPTYGDHPDPRAGDGQSLVRVTAAPVVPLDLLCASGSSYFGRPAVPYVPGVQGVGLIDSSDTIPVGSRVWFASSAGMAPGDGSLAELAVVPDGDVVAFEAEVDDAAVAALGLSAVAAWMALAWRGRFQPGERVVVLGAGGAVGQTAVAAARLLGAGRVVAVCRSEEARSRAVTIGADAVVPMVEDTEQLTAALAEACAGPVDVVVDPVFGTAATAASRVLAEGGRLVNLGGASGDEAIFSSALLRSRSAEVLGYTNNSLSTEQRRDAVLAIVGHAAQGRLGVAHETRSLSEAAEVWQAMSSGEPTGRVVLTP